MTAKEKAKELFNKFLKLDADYDYSISHSMTKEMALIAVDELIKQQNSYNNGSFYPSKYWQEVKSEIEKL